MSGHTADVTIPIPEAEDVEEKIAQSIIPYSRSDGRARYLGLRASGFTVREALKYIGYAKSTLCLWRKDPQFLDYEQRLPEYKKDLALEFANLEFMRNYRMVMEKDYRVLKKSLNPAMIQVKDIDDNPVSMEEPLSKQDQEYLIKMRTFYTPQQLQVLQTLIAADKTDDNFDFTKFVIEASKTAIRIEGHKAKVLPAGIIASEAEANGQEE